MSGELFSERFNRITRETQEVLKRWDERLVVPPVKLAERYLRGHFDLHLHISWRTDKTHVSGFQFPRHLLSDGRNLSIGRNIHLHDVDGEDKFSVFVDSVQIVNDPKGIPARVCSEVRLQRLDSCQRTGTGNALYFSAITANFLFCNATESRPFFENRKLDLSRGICLKIGRRQLPCNMIEDGSQVVNNFTSEHAKSGTDYSCLEKLYQFLPSYSISIGDDWFASGHIDIEREGRDRGQEVSDFPIELLDVLVGPF